MSFQICSDTTEATELCEKYRLYLKPIHKIKVSVQLPALKSPGQAISSWEVMEKLRNMIKPDEFVSLKVSKTNLVLIQFEGEVEKKNSFRKVLQKLQSNNMKLNGFSDVLKIRAAPSKLNYPSRHDWDSFFRDAKNMNEMKPGERPDTIFVQDLPIEWFAEDASGKPSEYVLKKVFESFGDVRQIAMPSMQENASTFGKVSSFNRDHVFDAYIQYKEYISFVKAMDSLKGMKLLYKREGGKSYSADIKVDFDRTRYLSDKSIIQRSIKQKLIAEKTNLKELSESRDAPLCSEKVNESKRALPDKKCDNPNVTKDDKPDQSLRRKEARHLLKALLHQAEISEHEAKARELEKQVAEKKLQQQKLLEKAQHDEVKRREKEAIQRKKYLQEQEKVLREKLLKSLKAREQRQNEEQREKLRKHIAGRKILKSVLVVLDPKNTTAEKSHRHHTSKKLKL